MTLPTPADKELTEIRRLNQETRKLLAEVATNQEKLSHCLDALDRAIVQKQSERRGRC
jgi:cell fate (sporulation/competence/biofilm development) regulator YlbF (YheA/YmcA/DUF963 family)